MFAQESVMDFQKEREAFQKFCEENFDFERHEQTYFDEQTQCYENDIGEDTESINMAWMAWQAAKAQAVPEGFVLVEKKEFEQMQEFEDLYRRAIFNSKKSIHEVNWSHVSNLGVGSTRAKAMCKRFNIDPEATFRKPQEPTND